MTKRTHIEDSEEVLTQVNTWQRRPYNVKNLLLLDHMKSNVHCM